jgi:hypothetical protein
MSRRGIGRVVVVGALVLLSATRGRAEPGSWADSLFDKHGIDFGPVPRGAKVRHNFVLTNRFQEPLTILDVRASCGCTSGRASTATVPPGGQAVIEAEMDTRNFVGPKATTLTVTLLTASGRQAEARFGVRSNILPDIVLNPGSVDFGVVAPGQTPEQTISIERVGDPNWRFARIIATPSFCKVVDATLNETYRNASGVGYSLSIKLRPDAPPGSIRDEIRLVTGDSQSPSVPILVTAQVQGSLTVTPALLALGHVSPAGTTQGRFLVRGTRPFTIRSIEGEGDGFTLKAANATPKTLHILHLAYKPGLSTTRGDLRRTFQITTDLAGEPPLEVTATLRVDP